MKHKKIASNKPVTVSFVVPIFNEQKRLDKTFEALRVFKMPTELALQEIIFVNDGSTDKTDARLSYFVSMKDNKNPKYKIPKAVYSIVSYTPNRGKGYAVRSGMETSSADYTLLFDADMSTPLSQIARFVPYMQEGKDVIIGTRKNGESTVIEHQPFIREFLGKCFTKLTNIALNTWISDFTCGFKAFSKHARETIFSKAVIERWGYDAEILFLARVYGLSLIERSVLWSNDEKTKVQLYKAIPQTLSELFKIRWIHSIKPFLKRSFNRGTKLEDVARVFRNS